VSDHGGPVGPGTPGGAIGLCALAAAVALGIPALVYLGAGAPGSAGSGVGALSATLFVGVLSAIGAVVLTRRSRPVSSGWATGLFVLATGFAVVQGPELAIADAVCGVCCLFFVIGLHMPTAHGDDRAGSITRTLDEFRPALIGAATATPGLIIATMVATQSSVVIGIAAGLLVVAVLLGLARRMV
jgi:hypothetical protein